MLEFEVKLGQIVLPCQLLAAEFLLIVEERECLIVGMNDMLLAIMEVVPPMCKAIMNSSCLLVWYREVPSLHFCQLA